VEDGATNVRWIWAPSHQDPGDPVCNHWSLYYPGDAYVEDDPDDYSLCTSQSAFDAFAALANDPFFGGTGAKATYACP
jgi:hypothetical protein